MRPREPPPATRAAPPAYCRVFSQLMLLCRGMTVEFRVTTLFDVDGGDKSGAFGRRGCSRALGLQPARRRAAAGQRHERRLLDAAARERVRAAWMEAAAAGRLSRIGHLPGE